jgi:hypothetical protein
MNNIISTVPVANRIEAKIIPRVSRISKYDLTIKTTLTQNKIVAQTNLSLLPFSKEIYTVGNE